nr:hypothetical protein [Tanacetum cinerariifolium]
LNKVKSSKLRRLKKVGTSQCIESLEDLENMFNQERINVDIDEGIELVVDQEKDVEIEGRQADTQAEIYNIDLDHSSKVLSMQEDDAEVIAASTPILAVKPAVVDVTVSTRKRKGVIIRDPKEELHDDTPAETLSVKDKGKGILVEDPKPMKKKDQIQIDAEYARKLQEEEESFKKVDWNTAFDHVQAKDVQAKGVQYIKRYHGYKKKPQSESEARKNMIAYLKNTEAVEIITTAKLMTEVVTAATTQVVVASTPISAAKPAVVAVSTLISVAKPAAKPKVLKIVAAAPAVSTRKRKGIIIRDPEEELHDDTPAETLSMKDKGKGILAEDPKPMKKKDQIEMDAEYARKLQEEEESHVQAKDVQPKDVQAKGIQYIRRYHGYKKKPQSESEVRKNMIAYLKNTEGFKMAFFKGKTYDQIRPIFQARFDANIRFFLKSREEMEKEEEEIIKSINETPAQKAAKRRRLREQAK